MSPKGQWKSCPQCGARVSIKNFNKHLRRSHRTGLSPPTRRRHIKSRMATARSRSRVRTIIVVGAIVMILLCASVFYIWYQHSGPGQDGDDYSPVHRPGVGADNFWTSYPNDHVLAGQPVPFPTWVSENASSRVLLVMVHSDCQPCIKHQKDIRQILEDPAYNTSTKYIDLLADPSEPHVNDCFNILDPEGHSHNIPLTIIVVRTPDGDYLWHSFEGVTGKANLMVWLKDAIYYWNNGVSG